MASPELIQSWAKTEILLREARAALPDEVVEAFRRDLEHFDEFLAHNELGLALDQLQEILDEASCTSPSLTSAMRKAEEIMARG